MISFADLDAVHRVAVFLRDDDVLRDVHELTREVAGVGRLEGRVGETLAGAVGRNEVLENREAFAERSRDRALDDVAVRGGHEAAHTGELADLELRATSLRVDEHVDRVQFGRVLVLGRDVLVDRLVELVADLLGRRRPNVDDLVVAFAVGDDALLELLLNLVGGLAGLHDLGVLLGRADHILEAHGRAGDRREAVAERLQAVDREHGLVMPRHQHLSFQKPISFGQTLLNTTRPAVVSMTRFEGSPWGRPTVPKSGFLKRILVW